MPPEGQKCRACQNTTPRMDANENPCQLDARWSSLFCLRSIRLRADDPARCSSSARRAEGGGHAESHVRRRYGQESQVQGMFGPGRHAKAARQGAQGFSRKVQEKLSACRTLTKSREIRAGKAKAAAARTMSCRSRRSSETQQ